MGTSLLTTTKMAKSVKPTSEHKGFAKCCLYCPTISLVLAFVFIIVAVATTGWLAVDVVFPTGTVEYRFGLTKLTVEGPGFSQEDTYPFDKCRDEGAPHRLRCSPRPRPRNTYCGVPCSAVYRPCHLFCLPLPPPCRKAALCQGLDVCDWLAWRPPHGCPPDCSCYGVRPDRVHSLLHHRPGRPLRHHHYWRQDHLRG